MNQKIKSIYLENLLGRKDYTTSKAEMIEICITEYIFNEIRALNIEKPEDANTIIGMLITLPSWFGIKEKFLDEYHALLVQDWHTAHEWLIDCIMRYKSPSSIKYIIEAIYKDFYHFSLSDTNYASFIRKCMWALADINTPESIEILQAYRNDESEIKRKCADEQLRWLNGEPGMRVMW